MMVMNHRYNTIYTQKNLSGIIQLQYLILVIKKTLVLELFDYQRCEDASSRLRMLVLMSVSGGRSTSSFRRQTS